MSPKSRSLAPKRGLTSGIDPEIHFQRPWGDSEAWQGSVTVPPPPPSWGGDGEGTPPFWAGFGSTNHLGIIELPIPAKPGQVLLHPQRKTQRDPSPIPGWNLSGGCHVRANMENGEKCRVGPDLWENCRDGMLPLRSPALCRGLRCSAVGAASPEPLRSLSAPDAIARQQLPVHLQFYP